MTAQSGNKQIPAPLRTASLIPSKETLEELDALEEIIFIGYPSGIWDRKNLLPIVRKGITATPIAVDFDGERKFLVDASVFPGSSGSPVFLYNAGSYHDKKSNLVVGSRLLFLGILTSVFYTKEENEIRLVPAPTVDRPVAVSRQMIDLGVVYKWNLIMETVESRLRKYSEI